MLSRRRCLGIVLAMPLLVSSISVGQAQVQLAQSCDSSIQFANNSGRTVNELYYNPTGNNNWGPDRLGSNVLRPGQTSNVRLQYARPYDFRMVWDNGQSSELRNVNICVVSRIVATNQGLRAQ